MKSLEREFERLSAEIGTFSDDDMLRQLCSLRVESGASFASLLNLADSQHSRTLLHLASGHNKPKCVEFLCESGAAVERADSHGDRPIHRAARFSTSPETISTLYKYGAKINSKGENGNTALHIAAFCNRVAVFEWLVRCGGARVDLLNDMHQSILQYAASNRSRGQSSVEYFESVMKHHGQIGGSESDDEEVDLTTHDDQQPLTQYFTASQTDSQTDGCGKREPEHSVKKRRIENEFETGTGLVVNTLEEAFIAQYLTLTNIKYDYNKSDGVFMIRDCNLCLKFDDGVTSKDAYHHYQPTPKGSDTTQTQRSNLKNERPQITILTREDLKNLNSILTKSLSN